MIQINEEFRISGDDRNFTIQKLFVNKKGEATWVKQPSYQSSLDSSFTRLLKMFDHTMSASEEVVLLKEFIAKREEFKSQIKEILYGENDG